MDFYRTLIAEVAKFQAFEVGFRLSRKAKQGLLWFARPCRGGIFRLEVRLLFMLDKPEVWKFGLRPLTSTRRVLRSKGCSFDVFFEVKFPGAAKECSNTHEIPTF
jgi:hypothetical protein